MRSLNLSTDKLSNLRMLCLGAHSDDIEIGCGGTILRLLQEFPNSSIDWIIFSAIGTRADEARRGACLFAGDAVRGLVLKEFRDGFLPFAGAEVKDVFEALKSVSPDLIFCPSRNDAHQDHRFLGELTWNTFRDHLIFEYEIPKYDGDLGQPSIFVPLDSDVYQKKVQYLMDVFQSQRSRHWFSEDTFLSLMHLRGMECNAPSGYAEAFYCRKLSI